MRPVGSHLMLRLRNGAVLAREVGAQRTLAASVLSIARPWPVLSFRASDDHLHISAAVEPDDAKELARRVEIGLQRSLDLPAGFQPAHVEPIADLSHLRNAFYYVLRQDTRHGFGHDPFAEASNLPDLLGLRIRGTWTAVHVRRCLPRVCRADLLDLLHAGDLDERVPDWSRLGEATAAALGLPFLAGRSNEAVEARRAAVHAAGDALGRETLAAQLGCSIRSVARSREGAPDERLVRAITGQLRLRSRAEELGAFVCEAPLVYLVPGREPEPDGR